MGVGAAPVATFNGVLAAEMVSLNDILVQTLSRHMDRKLAAFGAGAGADKQLRGHSLRLSLAMSCPRATRGRPAAGTPEFSALNEAGAVFVVQKEGGCSSSSRRHHAARRLLAHEEAAAAAGGAQSHVGGDDDDAAARAHAAAAAARQGVERVDRLNKKQRRRGVGGAELAAGVHTDVVGLGTVGFEKATLAVPATAPRAPPPPPPPPARSGACPAAARAAAARRREGQAHKELPPAEPIAGADESVAVYELVREAAK